MKLRNIFITCLAVSLFTACSNDDEKGKHADGKASLAIAVTSKSIASRADGIGKELPGETNINNLAAFVFNEAGTTLYGHKWETIPEGEPTVITDVDAQPERVNIVIIANAPENAFNGITTLSGLQNAIAALSDQQQNSLTMSSRVINTGVELSAGENFIGYGDLVSVEGLDEEIWLTRIAARLDILSIRTDFAGTKLDGRTVRINDIRLVNVKNASSYFSSQEWGAVEIDGNYAEPFSLFEPQEISDGNGITDIKRCYVMENSGKDAATSLVIDATLLGTPEWEEENATFTVPVNLNGINKGFTHNYIKRNFVYNITITFSETSFPAEPIIPTLNVQVEVVGWGQVIHNADVE